MTTITMERADIRRPDVRANIDLGPAVEDFVRSAPNNRYLEENLRTLDEPARLLLFLHRFVIFNDALAARVPYLAGLIHLTPNVFVEAGSAGFLGQVNARIAAHVAEAANDEYRITPTRNLVHQHLSQAFFRAALSHYKAQSGEDFERLHPPPKAIESLIGEARCRFFVAPAPRDLLSGLGFHLGLEFFANEEFNLVDRFLSERHPALVAALKQGGEEVNDYTWLALHTVVEVGHYRAGLEAVREAVASFREPTETTVKAQVVMDGLAAFADLQLRYYQAVFAELS